MNKIELHKQNKPLTFLMYLASPLVTAFIIYLLLFIFLNEIALGIYWFLSSFLIVPFMILLGSVIIALVMMRESDIDYIRYILFKEESFFLKKKVSGIEYKYQDIYILESKRNLSFILKNGLTNNCYYVNTGDDIALKQTLLKHFKDKKVSIEDYTLLKDFFRVYLHKK